MPPVRSKLPARFPEDLILTDTSKTNWRLGKPIGEGGFGLLYLATPDRGKRVTDEAEHVVKVEYHQNGPLFCELKFYQRAAKDNQVKSWVVRHRLDYIGIPKYWGSGEVMFNSTCYRFMVIDRLGMDFEKLFRSAGGKFPLKTIMHLGIRLLDVLEYIHENEYVHGDIKAANILLHYKDPNQVYLADYGLSYRYCPDGSHKPYKENPRKGHNGTIEFTSLDAHKGVALSRRADLQILAFCMLYWLCGKLPWDRNLKDPTAVQASKTKFVNELPNSVIKWAGQEHGSDAVAKFMTDVFCLKYNEKPNYGALRNLLLNVLESTGTRLGAPLTFSQLNPILKKPTAYNTPQYNERKVRSRSVSPEKDHRLQDVKKANQQPRRVEKSLNNSRRRNAKEVSFEKDEDANCMRNGDCENPCGLHRRNQGDLYPPLGTVNVQVVHNYSSSKDKIPRRFENDVDRKYTLQSEPKADNQNQKDIYKYSLLVIILSIMILMVLVCF